MGGTKKLDYAYTKHNAGICYAMNAAVSLARTDYIVYINDDMYVAPDWNGAAGSAILVHKKMWDLVGGYSVEFSPGFYSDSDFSMKLWQAGVRYFKGVSQSRVFHFPSKSVKRIVRRNDGRKQFAKKWNLTSYYFFKNYLRMATPFEGPLNEPEETWGLKLSRWRSRWL